MKKVFKSLIVWLPLLAGCTAAVEDPADLMSDTAPNRRFNYRFVWKR